MKRLTLNRISLASLRANRKAYRGLVIGIFLAVYLAATFSLCGYGIIKANEKEIIRRVGYTDCVLFDEPDLTDERLRESGLFSAIGHVYLKAEIKNEEVYLGYADAEAVEVLAQEVLEGRLPERAGEITLERSLLDKLRLEANVGDTVTWTLLPLGGKEEERSFTIVGFLREQSPYLSLTGSILSTSSSFDWPSAVISPEESFGAGNAVIHRVLRYAPLVTLNRVNGYFASASDDFPFYNFFGVSRTMGLVSTENPEEQDSYNYINQVFSLLYMGVALLLVTCIGISSAMEAVLDKKTEEIGMLRAVGATRRQIRRIFGREPWLISLVSMPGALLLAVLTCWLYSLIAPELISFRFSLWVLLPTILLSALSILISSALPLWRASRQLPMGVLRDTQLLRKARSFRSRKSFSAPRLIALRQLRLRPWRQLGPALILFFSLLMLSIFPAMFGEIDEFLKPKVPVSFQLEPTESESVKWTFNGFYVVESPYDLNDGDLAQIRALEHVEAVERSSVTTVNLVLEDEIPSYLLPYYTEGELWNYSVSGESLNAAYLLLDDSVPEPQLEADYGTPGYLEGQAYYSYQRMRAAAKACRIDGKLLPVTVQVIDSDADLSRYTTESGKIDLDALNRGEQVLVYAPECFVFSIAGASDDDLTGKSFSTTGDDEDLKFYLEKRETFGHIKNNYFYAGQTLSLAQLTTDDASALISPNPDYASMTRMQRDVTVGAVLTAGDASCELKLITTFDGARALGLGAIHTSDVGVSLDGDVDLETEKAIEERLAGIASRGNLCVKNLVALAREEQQRNTVDLVVILSTTLLFFAVSIAMLVSNAGRAIRADVRKIGTLRAVGADNKTLLRCYSVPMLFSIGLGTVPAFAFARKWSFLLNDGNTWQPELDYPFMLLFAALSVLCCLGGLQARLKSVLKESIVENIREL